MRLKDRQACRQTAAEREWEWGVGRVGGEGGIKQADGEGGGGGGGGDEQKEIETSPTDR